MRVGAVIGVLAGLFALAACAHSPCDRSRQTAESPPARNAALLYVRYWGMSDADRDAIDEASTQVTDPSWKPDADLCARLDGLESDRAGIVRATRIPECDFGIEFDQGFGARLPHPQQARSAVRLLLLSGRRDLADGRWDDAAMLAAATLRLAAHMSEDGVLISSFCTFTFGTQGLECANAVLDAAERAGRPLSGAARDELGEAINRFASDPVRGVETFRGEQRMLHGSFAKDPNGLVPQSGPGGRYPDAEAALASRLLEPMQRRADEMYDDLVRAWESPDSAREVLAQIEDRARNNQYGTVAGICYPAAVRLYDMSQRFKRGREAFRMRLAETGLTSCEHSPTDRSRETESTSVQNAALLYVRYWAISDADRDAISEASEHSKDPSWKPDADLCTRLDGFESDRAGIVRATRIPECDFAIEFDQGVAARMPHLQQARSAARLLLLSARRDLAEERWDDAAQLAAATLRLAAHMSKDGLFMSSMHTCEVGTKALECANAVLDAAQRAGRPLSPSARDDLRGAIDRFAADPVRGVAAFRGDHRILRATFANDPDGFLTTLERDGLVPDAETAAALRSPEPMLRRTDEMYDDLVQAWESPESPRERLKQVSDRAGNDEYGFLGRIFSPAAVRLYDGSQELKRGCEALRVRLESLD